MKYTESEVTHSKHLVFSAVIQVSPTSLLTPSPSFNTEVGILCPSALQVSETRMNHIVLLLDAMKLVILYRYIVI